MKISFWPVLLCVASVRGLVPNGTLLMELINCYAWWMPNAALRPDNSLINNCHPSDVLYCLTDSGKDDHFCHFVGTNYLIEETTANPLCYYNCQMETCNAWDNPTTDLQKQCVRSLYVDGPSPPTQRP